MLLQAGMKGVYDSSFSQTDTIKCVDEEKRWYKRIKTNVKMKWITCVIQYKSKNTTIRSPSIILIHVMSSIHVTMNYVECNMDIEAKEVRLFLVNLLICVALRSDLQ